MRRCPGAGSANTSSDEAAICFFNVRCTVITETRSTQPSSTTFSASERRVQRVRPGGAGEQAKATRRASNAPSKITFRGGRTRRLRSKTNSNPCSTNRRFKRSTVRAETPSASATRATVHPGPSGPRSHNNSARAYRNRLPVVLVAARVKPFNSARSSAVSVTR